MNQEIKKSVPEVRIKLTKERAGKIFNTKKVTEKNHYKGNLVEDLAKKIEDSAREISIIITLDACRMPLNYLYVGWGNPNSSSCYVGEIIKTALLSNASKVILIHNHPDGGKSFSYSDLNITAELSCVLNLVDLEFYDSIVVPRGGEINSLRLDHFEEFKEVIWDYRWQTTKENLNKFGEISERIWED